MSALIPVGSTFRKLALDLMRNSDTVDVKQLKKLWSVFEDSNNPMPAAVESEFRRVANAIEAPKISRQIARKRGVRDIHLHQNEYALPYALNFIDHPARYGTPAGRIKASINQADAGTDLAKRAKRWTLKDTSRPGRTAKTNTYLYTMQDYRHKATVERSNAELLEALMNLFEEQL